MVGASYLFTVLGVLTSYLVNFTVEMFNNDNWHLMLGLLLVPASAMFLLTAFAPESPRWLASKLRLTEAVTVLTRLRLPSDDVASEVRVILNSLFKTKDGTEPAQAVMDALGEQLVGPSTASATVNAGNASASTDGDSDTDVADDATALLKPDTAATRQVLVPTSQPASSAALADLIPLTAGPSIRTVLSRPDARRALLTCIGLEFFQQFSGIQAVTVYTPIILKESGVANLFVGLGLTEDASVLLITALIYSCKLPFLFLGIYVVDRIGRRRILLITIPVMTVALAGVSLSFSLPEGTTAGAIIAVVATTLFGCAYSPGLGSVISVIESEIFAGDVRSTGLVVTGIFGTIFNILVVQFYPALADALGVLIVFAGFAVVSAMAFVYVYIFVPETMRQPLELAYKKLLTKPAGQTSVTDDRADVGAVEAHVR